MFYLLTYAYYAATCICDLSVESYLNNELSCCCDSLSIGLYAAVRSAIKTN